VPQYILEFTAIKALLKQSTALSKNGAFVQTDPAISFASSGTDAPQIGSFENMMLDAFELISAAWFPVFDRTISSV
jgi:hypothetical protein